MIIRRTIHITIIETIHMTIYRSTSLLIYHYEIKFESKTLGLLLIDFSLTSFLTSEVTNKAC